MLLRRASKWLLCSFLLLSGTAFANMNIAFLDARRAIFETDYAKEFIKSLEEELEAEIDSVTSLSEQLTELRDQLSKDRDVISEEERSRVLADIRTKNLRIESQSQVLQQIQQQRADALVEQFGPNLQTILNDLIALEGYDAVIHFSRQTVLYVNPIRDITRKVTEKLNEIEISP